MSSSSLARVVRLVAASCFVVFLLHAGLAATGAPATHTAPSTATTSAATTSLGCVVVLECSGVTQKTLPDADGKFVFHDVPAGSCTVSAVPTAPPDAGAAASLGKHAELTAPRDAASGMATGKRQHPPRFQVSIDAGGTADKIAGADDASHNAVHVMVAERRKEFTGHVTLMK